MDGRRNVGWNQGLTGTLIEGRYQVLKRLGAGGMGTVYAARDLTLERDVAIKIGRPGASTIEVERFLREGRMVARLDHANIVRVFNLGRLPGGRPYMVMELLEGRTFGEVFREGPVELSRIIDRLWEIGTALDFIHARGVVHRDLKLDNLMLVRRSDGREVAKVFDFGIAVDRNDTAGRLTRDGSIMGTPLYIAPELVETDRLGPSTDIYAFGVVIYQLLTAVPPFEARSPIELLRLKVDRAAPLVSSQRRGITRDLDAVVARALARRPEDRYPTAGELVRGLARALPLRTPEPARPNRQLAIAGSVAFILAALISGYATLAAHHIEARSVAASGTEVAMGRDPN